MKKKINLKTSAIVLNYNNGRYLEEALNSIFQQTVKLDEIIVCDDASQDNSKEILNKYKDSIKIIYQKENKGPLKNCLEGINISKGDILFFLDADDIWMKNKVELILPIFGKDQKTAIVSHSHQHVNQSGERLNIYDQTHENIDYINENKYDNESRSAAYKNAILLREGGYWLGSAYGFRKKYFNMNLFSSLISSSYISKDAYPDLTIAPFIVATNPECIVAHHNDVLFKYRRHLNSSTPTLNDSRSKVRAISRIRKTSLLTKRLLDKTIKDYSLKKLISKRYSLIMLEYDYLIAIYSRQIILSIGLFIRLTPYLLKEGKFRKECIRLFGIAILGANIFLSISNKRYISQIKGETS